MTTPVFANSGNVQPAFGQEVAVCSIAGSFAAVDAYVQGGSKNAPLEFRLYATVGGLRSKIATAKYVPPASGPASASGTVLQWVSVGGEVENPIAAGGTQYDLTVYTAGTPGAVVQATLAGTNGYDANVAQSATVAMPNGFGTQTIVTNVGCAQFADVGVDQASLAACAFDVFVSCGAGSVEAWCGEGVISGPDGNTDVIRQLPLPVGTQYRLAVRNTNGQPGSGNVTASLATYTSLNSGAGSVGLAGQVFTTNNTPSAQWQYQTYVNVKNVGVKGDGVTDDAPAVRAAQALFAPLGVDLFFPPGTYLFNTPVVAISNSRWFGSGVKFKGAIAGASTDDAIIDFPLPAANFTTTINANNIVGSNQVIVTNAANIAIGKWLQITDQVHTFQGGFYEVTNVVGTTITLNRPVLWTFTVGANVSIYNADPMLVGFEIVGLGDGILFSGQCVSYVTLNAARNCRLVNLQGNNSLGNNSDVGFLIQAGNDNYWERLIVDGTGGNAGNKGLATIGQENFVAFMCEAFGNALNNWGINDNRSCDFEDCHVYDGAQGFTLSSETGVGNNQANRWLRFWNCSSIGNTNDGITFTNGSSDCFAAACLFSNNGASGVNCDGTGLGNANNVFQDCDCQQNTSYGYLFQPGAVRNRVIGGTATSNGQRNFRIDAGASDNFLMAVDASGASTYGILCTDDTTISNVYVNMTGASTALFVAGGNVRVLGGKFLCGNGQITVQLNAGSLQMEGAITTCGGGGFAVDVLGGTFNASQSNITAGAGGFGLRNSGGTCNLEQCTLPDPGAGGFGIANIAGETTFDKSSSVGPISVTAGTVRGSIAASGNIAAAGGTFTHDVSIPIDTMMHVTARVRLVGRTGGHATDAAGLAVQAGYLNNNGAISNPGAIAGSNNPANSANLVASNAEYATAGFLGPGPAPPTAAWSISGTNARLTVTNSGATAGRAEVDVDLLIAA